jgi:hypothetical protein
MDITQEQQRQRRQEVEAKTSKRYRKFGKSESEQGRFQQERGKKIVKAVMERMRLEAEADQKRQ